MEHAGVTIQAELLYPFRNAIISGFEYEETLVYEDVINKFCDYLDKARKSRSYISMKYIEEQFWPTLMITCALQNGNVYLNVSDEHKFMMQMLSDIVKNAVDKKRNRAGKK